MQLLHGLSPVRCALQSHTGLQQGPAVLCHVLQVLRFTGGVERLFSGWADGAAAERFKRRLDQYGAIWCCVNAHPGHVWYDFFHDTQHTDRHGRLVEKWQPVTGP